LRLGHRSELAAQVLEGLEPGEEVILYPSDRIRDGVTVVRRTES
jgi:HlyD family secretion protein